MTSFWEKLKKGMGIEVAKKPEKEELEKKPKPVRNRKKKVEAEKIKVEPELSEQACQNFNKNLNEQEIKQVEEKKGPETEREEEKIKVKKEKWFESEGQLTVDVYETNDQLIIQSAIAGVKPENLDISIEADLVTIKGERKNPNPDSEKKMKYFYQECYWGPFSREIILPEETDPSRAEATMKEGILIIRIPKIGRKQKRKIIIKEEERGGV